MIYLSPSALNLMNECERCFYDDRNKINPRPRGIFPSLPGGMDRIFKAFFDKQAYKLPDLPGKLFDRDKVESWRSWRGTDLKYKTAEVICAGAIDDCMEWPGGELSIIDFKTKGAPMKDDAIEYNQLQMDCYELFLQASGYQTKGIAYLIYYWPVEMINAESLKLDYIIKPLEVSTANAILAIDKAVKILKSKTPPNSSSTCEFCRFRNVGR
jgi:hypothetical protein